MFIEKISPRFVETDALGHINNTVIPVWFEQARKPIFQLFTPDLDPKKWKLIIARIEVDFLAETHFGHEVEIHTNLAHVGNASFKVRQELWQRSVLCAKGLAILVHYNYGTGKSSPIPADVRQQLIEHLSES